MYKSKYHPKSIEKWDQNHTRKSNNNVNYNGIEFDFSNDDKELNSNDKQWRKSNKQKNNNISKKTPNRFGAESQSQKVIHCNWKQPWSVIVWMYARSICRLLTKSIQQIANIFREYVFLGSILLLLFAAESNSFLFFQQQNANFVSFLLCNIFFHSFCFESAVASVIKSTREHKILLQCDVFEQVPIDWIFACAMMRTHSLSSLIIFQRFCFLFSLLLLRVLREKFSLVFANFSRSTHIGRYIV